MNILLTTLGQSTVAASLPAPPVFSEFRLADSLGYLPSASQTSLVGATVYTGVPSTPQIVSNNLLKYTLSLDANVGPFQFGEVGLYLPGGQLAAVGVSSTMVVKTTISGSTPGNSVVIDFYVSTSGTNYSVYAELGNSNYPMNLQALAGVDTLPAASNAFPNIYMISSPDGVGSILVHSNNALWSIQGYEDQAFSGVTSSAGSTHVASLATLPAPAYQGELVVQFTSGPSVGVCRVVATFNSALNQYDFVSPISTIPPAFGDQFIVLRKIGNVSSSLLSSLDPALTAGMLNELVLFPVSSLVAKDGSTPRTGVDNFGGFRASNLATPVLPFDASNKQYVDTLIAGVQPLLVSGVSLKTINGSSLLGPGNIALAGSAATDTIPGIVSLAVSANYPQPINDTDAATPAYVNTAVTSGVAASFSSKAASGANSDITSLSGLTTPLSISQGGTSSSTPSAARSALGAAASGVNSDITQLSGISSPLTISQGGTGSNTALSARSALGAAAAGVNSDITSLSSPILGAATATTPALGSNTNQVATTAFVTSSISAIGLPSNATDSSPGIVSLAVASNFPQAANDVDATTPAYVSAAITASLLSKANAGANSDITSLASPDLASATALTQLPGTNTTQVATTAFVTDAVNTAVISAGSTPVATDIIQGKVSLAIGTNYPSATDSEAATPAYVSNAIAAITSLPALSTPISVAQGGTGATTPLSARTAMGAAASGVNTDITSLASPDLASATATTQSPGTNTTQVATTAFVTDAVASVVIPTATTTVAGKVALAVGSDFPQATNDVDAATPLYVANAISASVSGVSGPNSTITSLSGLTTPLSAAQGGTGSNTASGARTNLGAAASGANSDITSLSSPDIGAATAITPPAANSSTRVATTAFVSGELAALPVATDTVQGKVSLAVASNFPQAANDVDATTPAYVAAAVAAGSSGLIGPNNSITSLTGLTTPLSVSQGGTGSTTAAGSRTNIGAAASGANTDISSLASPDLSSATATTQSPGTNTTQVATTAFVTDAVNAAVIAAGSTPVATDSIQGKVSLAIGTNYPSASDSEATTPAYVSNALAGITSLPSLSTAITVAQGGTGATNAASARSNLGAAESGANTSITSLSSPSIGAATATTQAAADSTTKVATTAFTQSAISLAATPAATDTTQGKVALAVAANYPATGDLEATTPAYVSAALAGVTSLPALATAITVAQGGTGSTTAAGGRSALGAAASGANSDITSLTGLTTPLSVAQGGTGSTTSAGARTNLGAAASGANSDITSLNAPSIGAATATTATAGNSTNLVATTAFVGSAISAIPAASGTNSTITSLTGLTTPLSVFQGGTGSNTASGARSAISAAESGANTDITSLNSPSLGDATVNTQPLSDNSTKAASTAYVTNAVNVAVIAAGSTPIATDLIQGKISLAVAANYPGSGDGEATTPGYVASAISGITSLPSLSTSITVAQGGTGATSASGARTALGAAASGANTDITSLSSPALGSATADTASTIDNSTKVATTAFVQSVVSAIPPASGTNSTITSLTGLTTPLSVSQGGTGANTSAGARTSIGAAASGSNTDITSLSSPSLGTATASTATAGDSSTLVATTAFVSAAVTAGAPTPTSPLTVATGGTGSNSASGARTNLGAAASGANTDITSLSSPSISAATATTATAGNSSTLVATTAFVATAISNIAAATDTVQGKVALNTGGSAGDDTNATDALTAAGLNSLLNSASSNSIKTAISTSTSVNSLIQNQTAILVTTSGSGTAYTATPSPAVTAYTAGQSFWTTFHVASGSSPTLQLSGLASPPSLVRQNSSGAYVSIAAGDIPINHRSRVTLLSSTQALVEIMPPAVSSIGETIEKTITQTAHGFVTTDVLYYNGSAYAKAKADTAATAEVVGVVGTVIDSANFRLIAAGFVTGFSGLTPGVNYFLSTSVDGSIQDTAPSTNGQYNKPLLTAVSTTSGWLNIMRGSLV